MKILKIAAVIFLLGFLLQIYGKINLQVSYKYEVDLMETNIKTDNSVSDAKKAQWLKEMEERKHEIFHQQKVVEILYWFFLIGFIIIVCLMIYKWSRQKKQIDSSAINKV